MRDAPSSSTLASPSAKLRDPDGVDLREEYSFGLEPLGSHSRDDEGEEVLDMKKVIGTPPPPPTGTPPKGKKNEAIESRNPIEATTPKKSNEGGVRDDCDVISVDPSSKAEVKSSSEETEETEETVSSSPKVSSDPKSKAKDQNHKKKRGFFKKLFGAGKSRKETQSNETIDPVSPKNQVSKNVSEDVIEAPSDESNETEESKSVAVEETKNDRQGLSLDPPDNNSALTANLQVDTDNIKSKDPVGASPTLRDSPIVREYEEETSVNRQMSSDPQGETPKARQNARFPSSDPVGESFTHVSRMKKTAVEADSKSSEFVNPGSSDAMKSEKKQLSVATAAFTNAKAIALLHQLDGEPSPRLTWHTKNSTAPPLSEKDAALAKIRAYNLRRKKEAKVEVVRKTKGPSPDDYCATNSEIEAMMKGKNYVNHDPNKQFAAYSRFQGRRPRTKNEPNEESPPTEIPTMPLQDEIQPTINLELIVPSGNLCGKSIARGIELRQMKQKAEIESGLTTCLADSEIQKPIGRNRFNLFPRNEADIKDPIKRAGRRLLSKSAIPIQAGFRMYMSRKEAMDRMWALIRIQSYVRRWKCEANFHTHKRSATLVQKVYRGYRSREDLKNQNVCAISIQKIVRGYLTALHTYETMCYITRAQALARGFLVRTANARRANEVAATAIQSAWRSFAARVAFKQDVLDIIAVQSIIRRRLAIRKADLARKSLYSPAITSFQALWRGYAERSARQKFIVENTAATKIQAHWRGFQAYTDFIFVIVDILVVQRKTRQWLAVRNADKLRREKAATFLQSAWRRNRAEVNLLYSLVNIILIQSTVRRFLAKKEVEVRRKEREEKSAMTRKKELAAIAIQKSWRGFWGFSHFVIVRYETTRIQALVRGKLERNRYNLKLGCVILIQAVFRGFKARKAASTKASARMIDRAVLAARVLELRERNSAKHIQFWWRIVLDWSKEKKAALVIERFFIHVRAEVDRELRLIEEKRIMKEKARKKKQKASGFNKDLNKKSPAVNKNSRRKSAPLPRPSQRNFVVKDTNNFKSFLDMEMDDFDFPPTTLNLAPSGDFSMVSNLTNPSVLDRQFLSSQAGQNSSENVYQQVKARSKNEKKNRLSTDDYIKKYGGGLKTAPNRSLSKSQSQHFFSDERNAAERKPNRQSQGVVSAMYTPRQSKSTTPRGEARGQYEKSGFEGSGKKPATPPRSSSGGYRSGSTPRNSARSRKDGSPSKFLPPMTPTRKKSGAILRSGTAVTECSTPVENDSMYIPPRPRPSPRKHSSSPIKHSGIYGRGGGKSVMIMKTNPDFADDKTIQEAHEIMLLGADYGEV